jgi:mannan endo-1,4-beta-mannosidase
MSIRLYLLTISLALVFKGTGTAAAAPPLSPPFWGAALDGYPVTVEMLEEAERETGFPPRVVVFSLQWPTSPVAAGFPKESLDAIWTRGGLPVVTWEPMYYEGNRERMIPYERILNGSYDPYIKAFAAEARAWGRPFIMRFAHEMNIERYHWGTEKEAYGPLSPRIYKRMYQYLFSLFRKAGAGNVLWAFCPNAESVPNTSYDPKASWNRACNYYPGDSYVDLLGMDGYNWGTTQTVEKNGWKSRWQSFREIFSPIYQQLKDLSPGKPLFVFETASAGKGGEKGAWTREAIETARQWGLQGLVWFQVKKEIDWRINSEGDTSYLPLVRATAPYSQDWIRLFMGK